MLHTKIVPKLIGNGFCNSTTFKNPNKPGFSIEISCFKFVVYVFELKQCISYPKTGFDRIVKGYWYHKDGTEGYDF